MYADGLKLYINEQFKSIFTVEPSKPLPDKGLSPHPWKTSVSKIKTLLQNPKFC